MPSTTLTLDADDRRGMVDLAALSGDGRRALTVREVGTARIWDTTSGSLIAELRPRSPLEGRPLAPMGRTFRTFVESAALDRDGTTAILGLNDGTALTLEVPGGARLGLMWPPDEEPASCWSVIRSVAFSADGSLVAAGFSQRAVGVWAEKGRRLIGFFRAPPGKGIVGAFGPRHERVSSVAISQDNRYVFAGASDLTAAVWDLQSGALCFEARGAGERILSVFDNREGVGWATTGGTVWIAKDGGEPRKLLDTQDQWAEVAFQGSQLLARCYDHRVSRWTFSGKRTKLVEDDLPAPLARDDIVTLGFATAERFHYPVGITALDVVHEGGTTRIDLQSALTEARFGPAGDTVATRCGDRRYELWSVGTGTRLDSFQPTGCVAFSADGTRIALDCVTDGDPPRHYVEVSDFEAGWIKARLRHPWSISKIEFSPDGRWLAARSRDVAVWKLRKPGWLVFRPVGWVFSNDGQVPDFRFLSDGRLLVLDGERAHLIREGKRELAFPAPFYPNAPFTVDSEERTLTLSSGYGVARYDLAAGERIGQLDAAIPWPELLPDRAVAWRGGILPVLLWRTRFGLFLHQRDGPRGWMQGMSLSSEGKLTLPSRDGAAIVDASNPAAPPSWVPFDGWGIRAGRIVDGEVILVNQQGRLFRSALADARPRQPEAVPPSESELGAVKGPSGERDRASVHR